MTSRRLALVAVALAAVGLILLTFGVGRDQQEPAAAAPASITSSPQPPVAATTPAPTSSSTPTAASTTETTTTSTPPVQAPPLRQRPQLYPDVGVDPATVDVVSPPQGELTAAELSTPTAAVAAWASRWCPFTSTDALGVAEQRAKPAMTPAGWASFDPQTDPVAVGAWAGVTAGGLSGTCAAPAVVISPEAPASPDAAYVTVTMKRVVAAVTGPSTVETVTDTRLVLLVDGRWLVDTPAAAG